MLSTLQKSSIFSFARLASTVTLHIDGVKSIEAPVGVRLDKVLKEQLPGFKNSCNGGAVCAKCVCEFGADDFAKLPAMGEDEADCLEDVELEGTNRLTCQMKVTSDMDGVHLKY